jgi:hypothetical protein
MLQPGVGIVFWEGDPMGDASASRPLDLRIRAGILIVFASAVLLGPASTASAGSGPSHNKFDQGYEDCVDKPNIDLAIDLDNYIFHRYNCLIYAPYRRSSAPPAAESPALAAVGVYQTHNLAATLEPGETNVGGLMKKTVWSHVKVTRNARIVVHTFGTAFDSVTAVYRGSKLNALTRIAANDNYPVPGVYTSPGFSAKQSLVQFDATANVDYRIQFGSRTGAEGDIYENVFYFPPGGGIAAEIVGVNNQAWFGQDYVCGFFGFSLNQCGNPTFLVHNSSDKTVTVTSTSDFGAGMIAPAPFVLPPGKAKAVKFSIGSNFDKTTVRTIVGRFTFSGKVGTTVTTVARVRGLIVIGPNAEGPDVLKFDLTSTPVRSAHVNQEVDFTAKLTNTGSAKAVGCHVRGDTNSRLLTAWQRINPLNGKPVGSLDTPLTIPAGGSVSLRVHVASQTWRVADPTFGAPITFDCASTQPAAKGLGDRFDFSALDYHPADVTVAKTAPTGDVLNVPKTGSAVFRVSALNTTPKAHLSALAIYSAPFEEGSEKQFKVTICRTATDNGACLVPASTEVVYTADKNAKSFFKVFVRAPTTDPGFDPTKRRVFFKLRQINEPEGSFEAVVGTESVAVKRN